MNKAREIAAQCWHDKETENVVLSPLLAEAFAKRINRLLGRIEELEHSEELAWGLIANGGDWDLASETWKNAAEHWVRAAINVETTPTPDDPKRLAWFSRRSWWPKTSTLSSNSSEVVDVDVDRMEQLEDSEELAWGLIANAYGGDWDLASEASGWKAAAERWRDAYHAIRVIRGDKVEEPNFGM